MITGVERQRLEAEVARFQSIVDALTARLGHTLVALALTFDAQAATRQRLNGHNSDDEQLHDSIANLQTAAEHYRHLARTLTDGKH